MRGLWGQAPYSAPASLLCDVSLLFNLHSSEAVLQGHLRFWGGIFLLQVLAPILQCYCSPSLLFVPVGEVLAVWSWAVGLLQTALGSSCATPLNQLYNSFSAPPMLCSLPAASCSSATCHRSSSTWHTFGRQVCCPVPASGEASIHLLQSEFCTAVLSFSSPACVGGIGHCQQKWCRSPIRAAALLSDECPPFCPGSQVG